MTPNEYRQKHKRCATCEYWIPDFTNHFAGINCGKCKVKNITKTEREGRFCRLYRAEELKNEN